MQVVSYPGACGNPLSDQGVQPGKTVLSGLGRKTGQGDAAADINPHYLGQDPTAYSGCKSDGSDFAGVNVRHDTDLASCECFIIAKRLDLCQGVRLNACFFIVRVIDDCRCIASVYDFHDDPFLCREVSPDNRHKNTSQQTEVWGS